MSTIRKSGFALALGLALAGCSGAVTMTPMSPQKLAANYDEANGPGNPGPDRDIDGIIVYRSIQLVQVEKLTQAYVRADGQGEKSDTQLTNECEPVFTRKVVSVPDTQHPYVVRYDHGFLEGYTFSATLDKDGVLTNVNSESTPDQGRTLQALSAAAAGALPIFEITKSGRPEKPAERPKCTVTPTFAGYENPPAGTEIKDFGTIK